MTSDSRHRAAGRRNDEPVSTVRVPRRPFPVAADRPSLTLDCESDVVITPTPDPACLPPRRLGTVHRRAALRRRGRPVVVAAPPGHRPGHPRLPGRPHHRHVPGGRLPGRVRLHGGHLRRDVRRHLLLAAALGVPASRAGPDRLRRCSTRSTASGSCCSTSGPGRRTISGGSSGWSWSSSRRSCSR